MKNSLKKIFQRLLELLYFLKKYNQKTICRFIENPELIDMAGRLEEYAVPYERVEALLEKANCDELYRHSYEVIRDVLQSTKIDKKMNILF